VLDASLLSLNTATVKVQWTLAQAIEGCARHRIRGIAPWRDKLAEMGVKQAAAAIKANGLTVTGLCRGGFFTAKDWRDDNRRAIEEAHAIGAQCLVLVVGGLAEGSKDLAAARERVKEGIAEILPEARKAGMPLAIEPLHPMQAADRASRRSIYATRWARASASRWTSTTCGGIRSSRPRSGARGASACSRITSATGWCPRATR
jgi:sugar phosphate isomerase/epimerase